MKSMTGGFLVLAAFFATGMTDVTAQQARRDSQMRGIQGRQEGGIEPIMRLGERLELTEDQLGQLDEIRRENVQRRTAEMAQMIEVRSQYAATQVRQEEARGRDGQQRERLIRRSNVMAAMEDRQEEARGRDGQQRERLESILTEGQQESLNSLRRRARVTADRGEHVACAAEEDLRDATVSAATAGVDRGPAISVVTVEDDAMDEGDIGSH